MIAPVSVPRQSPPAAHHRTIDISMTWRHAPWCCAFTSCGTVWSTLQRETIYKDMPIAADARRSAQKIDQGITASNPACVWARMSSGAAAI